ncbi:chaperonin 60 subunit beta 4, chloroplastic isoform X4 [Carya illinoinensis]|uniref:chaperonin 60 subunit beta 4, chloroplastic isoform X4 n=1 Tax=Carya illinoinensis TaxID=32201 RepID=UPI001C726E3E|nr:chaperonin 60 subunit beta 4, chloroplastic isoform X4 [Carya illinoinensis]
MASSPTAISALNFTNPILPRRPSSPSMLIPRAMAKELYFNRDGSTTRKLQAGVDMVAELVGVTLGPKGRNVVLQNKYGPPKIVNDGETVLKEIIAAGMNPVQVARGIEKTANALVSELKLISREVEDHEIAHVAAVSAGNDYSVGNMIADALRQVGRKGVVTIEKGKCTENNLQIVEGMQFDRGYLSPYFVTDRQKMTVEFHNCKLLLVDRKITNPKEMFGILDSAVKEKYPIVIVAEGIEKEALAPVIRNKLRGVLKAAAIKAPAFGERKSHYLDDIAILTGGTVIRDEMGLSLEKAGKEALGSASKVVITKDSTLIVTDGSTHEFVEKRVSQLQELVKNSEEKFQKKLLSERIARLSGGIAILQVGAQTQVELKDKQLRIEDALNATKAAIEEGVVVGGGCTLLRLSTMVDGIKQHLDNEEQKFMQVFSGNRISFSINVFSVLQSCNYFPLNAHKDCNVIYGSALQIGAEIFKRALSYPARLIAKNAGVNGNLVIEKVLSNDDIRYGYNAARDCYEDLVKAGIIDPSKVVRCCLEHAASVAKTFLTSDAVVVDIKELEPIPRRPPMPPIPRRPSMPTSGINPIGF